MAQAACKTCEICMSSPGRNCCEQCDQLFCDGCKISHLRTKMSKNHTFLSGPNINPEVKLYCKEHDENFIYYCLECGTPVCKICAIKNHRRHDLSEIKESLEDIKAEVKTDIETKIKKLQINKAEFDQGTRTHQADVIEVIQAIREEGNRLKEMIDQKVEGLINTVKENDSRNVQTLQSVGNELKTALDKAKEQQKFYQDNQGIKDITKVLQKLKHIKSQIDKIEEIHVHVMPPVKYAKQKVAESAIEKLFGVLTFGSVFTEVQLVVSTEEAQLRINILKAFAKKLEMKLKKDRPGKRSPVVDYRDEYSSLREQMDQVKQCFRCPDEDEHESDEIYYRDFERPRTNAPSRATTAIVHNNEREPLEHYKYSESRNNEREDDSRVPFHRSRNVDPRVFGLD